MDVIRFTYKETLSNLEILKYGLLHNLKIVPYFSNKEFIILRKYNVSYNEISGETKAIPTPYYCLVDKKDIKKDDSFNKFYFIKQSKILTEDKNLNILLTDKTYSVLEKINSIKFKELFKYEKINDEKDFSYSLLLESYKDKSTFSPTRLKIFIEKILIEIINNSKLEEAKELKTILINTPKKKDVLYYCFFPKLCYYLQHYEEFNVKTLILEVTEEIKETDASKLFTNIDLEILLKRYKEKSTL